VPCLPPSFVLWLWCCDTGSRHCQLQAGGPWSKGPWSPVGTAARQCSVPGLTPGAQPRTSPDVRLTGTCRTHDSWLTGSFRRTPACTGSPTRCVTPRQSEPGWWLVTARRSGLVMSLRCGQVVLKAGLCLRSRNRTGPVQAGRPRPVLGGPGRGERTRVAHRDQGHRRARKPHPAKRDRRQS
jgi:hypothetical protein